MYSLYFWHQNLALQNSTTIEFHLTRWAVRKAKEKGKKYTCPYDHGPPQNLRLFYGPNSSKWLCPIPPSNLTDGLSYPMTYIPEHEESDDEDQYSEEALAKEEIIDV